MSHRVFQPVILFHEHSYSNTDSNKSGTHRIHIPYGDPYYTPLIEQKKNQVGIMLKTNGKAWYDIIQYSRQQEKQQIVSPKPTHFEHRRGTQLILEQYGSNHNHLISSDEDEEEESSSSNDDNHSLISGSIISNDIQSPQSNNTSSHVITRKRRGNLPKSVTAVLKQWLIDHCRNPYPTEIEKTGLKDKTGLTLNQISNWFINARRRLLPQILDSHTNLIQDDPIPNHKRKRRSASNSIYQSNHNTNFNAKEQKHILSPVPSSRKRKRYNTKKTTNSNITIITESKLNLTEI